MILGLVALAAAGCTTETTAAPTTVTRTVTDTTVQHEETQREKKPAEARPCTSVHVEAAVAPGEYPTPQTWQTAVVVTNLGPDVCSLEGASELRFFTGGDGQRLEVNQVMTDGAAAEPVVLAVSEQASMGLVVPTAPEATPDCLEGGAFVDVVLAGEDAVSAEAPVPPICGAVHVDPWAAGGAPGAAPN
jgi:hypothetical protein